ncbi:hypothetical protein AB0K25_00840 [Micromonospora sp. NPDC049257]|uniref:hypothetical protein n=1 Tax=Micromonospora sp. NPDC049257 TaxID=3155771 RepID=UPI0034175A79
MGLCPNWAVDRRLRALLTGPAGVTRPELEPLLDVLKNGDATSAMHWLRNPSPQGALLDLAAGHGAVTHEILDRMQPYGTVQLIRAALVTAGALPPRDEQLARLEDQVLRIAARVSDPGDRRTVRSFATWHHLRRLRCRKQPASYEQINSARTEIRAAAELVNWLRQHGTTLADCRQHDIDEWLTGTAWLRVLAQTFLAWAVRNRHAQKVSVAGQAQPLTGSSLTPTVSTALIM